MRGGVEGALHRDLKLFGAQGGKLVFGPWDELPDIQVAVAGDVRHAALVVEW